LNDALTYVAQEVSELLQQSHLAVEGDNNPVGTIAIRAIEQNTQVIITVEPLTERGVRVLQLIVMAATSQRWSTLHHCRHSENPCP